MDFHESIERLEEHAPLYPGVSTRSKPVRAFIAIRIFMTFQLRPNNDWDRSPSLGAIFFQSIGGLVFAHFPVSLFLFGSLGISVSVFPVSLSFDASRQFVVF